MFWGKNQDFPFSRDWQNSLCFTAQHQLTELWKICLSARLPAFWVTGEFSLQSCPSFLYLGNLFLPHYLVSAFGRLLQCSGWRLECLREIFLIFMLWLLPYPWGRCHRCQGRCLSTPLPYPKPLVYSCYVFGEDPWGRVGWWCRPTLWLGLLEIPVLMAVHMWPLKRIKNLWVSPYSSLWWIPVLPATLLGMKTVVGPFSLEMDSTHLGFFASSAPFSILKTAFVANLACSHY